MLSKVVLALVATNIFQSASCVLQCPDIKPVENFNMTAYGCKTWYELARYPNPFLTISKCSSFKFTFDGEKVRAEVLNIPQDSPQYFEGHATLAPGARGTGKLIISATYGLPRTTVDIAINALIIDYDRFAVFYTCNFDEVTKTALEFVWILARTNKLEDAERDVIAKLVKSKIIDESKLIWIDNSDESCKQSV